MGNIIKHNRPIEHEIGTIVRINNEKSVVVESDDTCDNCILAFCCSDDFLCRKAERTDGKNIIYKAL